MYIYMLRTNQHSVLNVLHGRFTLAGVGERENTHVDWARDVDISSGVTVTNQAHKTHIRLLFT